MSGTSGTPPQSGTVLSFDYVSNVSDTEFEAATDALDRALLVAIGLPKEVDIRLFENAVYSLVNKITTLIKNFSFATALWIIPEILEDAIRLWDKMEPTLRDKINRTDFISRTIVYAYKKNNPNLPWIEEPFETMIENLLFQAVPALVKQADEGLEPLIEKWIKKLQKFFS